MSGPIVRAVMAEIERDLAGDTDRVCGVLWYCDAFPLANVDVSFRHQDAVHADEDVPLP